MTNIFTGEVKSTIDNAYIMFRDLRGKEVSEELKISFNKMIVNTKKNPKKMNQVYLMLVSSLGIKGLEDDDFIKDCVMETLLLEEEIMDSDLEYKEDILSIAYWLFAKDLESDYFKNDYEYNDNFNALSMYIKSYEYGYIWALVDAIRVAIFGIDTDIDHELAQELINEAKEKGLKESIVYDSLIKFWTLLESLEGFSFNLFDEFDFHLSDDKEMYSLLVHEIYKLAVYVEAGFIKFDSPLICFFLYYTAEKLGYKEAKYDLVKYIEKYPELKDIIKESEVEVSKIYNDFKKLKEH